MYIIYIGDVLFDEMYLFQDIKKYNCNVIIERCSKTNENPARVLFPSHATNIVCPCRIFCFLLFMQSKYEGHNYLSLLAYFTKPSKTIQERLQKLSQNAVQSIQQIYPRTHAVYNVYLKRGFSKEETAEKAENRHHT